MTPTLTEALARELAEIEKANGGPLEWKGGNGVKLHLKQIYSGSWRWFVVRTASGNVENTLDLDTARLRMREWWRKRKSLMSDRISDAILEHTKDDMACREWNEADAAIARLDALAEGGGE